ncbi:MerR family DNA-binding transcriptional regulator [Chryseolinea sp. Jin1]|uniref:MerR family DNA-binding transcriptional regulator n=2 Tax=Chryseolinea lacunae TaxID=2801331 RepID=A0ABS1KZN0_9BACT|nr:MerR family DNA-binding transcriptional regulator [Chryseolinea lacunae]
MQFVLNRSLFSNEMDLREQFVREIFETYLKNVISKTIPTAIRNALKESNICQRQEFVSIKEASKKYDVSTRTLYNYHKRGYITLRSTEGKTFVSVIELEDHIKNHPIPRNPW